MIITIALNPGIEKHLQIEKYNEGTNVPVQQYELRIAGSGIYAAYIMRMLQAEPYVLGFAGGIGGKYIKNFLDKNRIKSNLVTKDKELKTTVIITNNQGVTTRLVDDEEAFAETDGKNIKHKMVAHLDEAELVFINGAIKHEGSRDIIHESIDNTKEAHKRLLLSLDGWEIQPFIERSPMAVMLDEKQVEILTEHADSLEDTLEQLREIGVENMIHYIFFQTGNQVIGITKNKISYGTIHGAALTSVSWSKDALSGAMAIGIKRRYEFERILKLMTAVNYSISEAAYPVLCSRKDVDTYMNKVKIIDYFSNGTYTIGDGQ